MSQRKRDRDTQRQRQTERDRGQQRQRLIDLPTVRHRKQQFDQ